jgi:DNA primase
MFPIQSCLEGILGFGGRIQPMIKAAKYLKSESDIYHKVKYCNGFSGQAIDIAKLNNCF